MATSEPRLRELLQRSLHLWVENYNKNPDYYNQCKARLCKARRVILEELMSEHLMRERGYLSRDVERKAHGISQEITSTIRPALYVLVSSSPLADVYIEGDEPLSEPVPSLESVESLPAELQDEWEDDDARDDS